MNIRHASQAFAVDIGNSFLKVGRFSVPRDGRPAGLPVIDGVERVEAEGARTADSPAVLGILDGLSDEAVAWYVVSVNRPAESRFSAWVRRRRPQDVYLLLTHERFPLDIDVREPRRVGTDRLAAAAAANRLRAPDRPAIVVDAGTAITVDVVSAAGVFRGGAILPGLRTAAAALARNTDALPVLEDLDLSIAPDAIGTCTRDAMRSGLYWGWIGAIKELIGRMSSLLPSSPDIICAGGDVAHLAPLLGYTLILEPNLVLRGVAEAGCFASRLEA
ncbi:MAG: type III pantothenate kinase [Planctomycetes bacterium]|nr:type III pantothenate kinase [Planctomycetota bacterium]